MATLIRIAVVIAVTFSTIVQAQEGVSSSRDPQRLSIWVQPLPIAATLMLNGFAVPVGVSAPLAEGMELHVEGLVFSRRDLHEQFPARKFDGWMGSAGVTFRSDFSRRWSWLLTPKTTLGTLVQRRADGRFGEGSTRATLVHLGADAGVEFRAGNLLLGTGLGVSGGYCHDCREGLIMPVSPWTWPVDENADSSATFMLNLNLLRVGFTI